MATILSQSLNVQPHPLHTRLHGLHQGPGLLSSLAPDAQHVTLDTDQNAEQARSSIVTRETSKAMCYEFRIGKPTPKNSKNEQNERF